VPSAAVPEAAVNEHCDLQPLKYEVGMAEHGTVPPPSYYSVRTKDFCQSKLSRFIAALPNCGHDS